MDLERNIKSLQNFRTQGLVQVTHMSLYCTERKGDVFIHREAIWLRKKPTKLELLAVLLLLFGLFFSFSKKVLEIRTLYSVAA